MIRSRNERKPLPYYVRWYEQAGWYTLLRCQSFADPDKRDRFARKLAKRPGFIRYA